MEKEDWEDDSSNAASKKDDKKDQQEEIKEVQDDQESVEIELMEDFLKPLSMPPPADAIERFA